MMLPKGTTVAVAGGEKLNLFRNAGDEAGLKLALAAHSVVDDDVQGSGSRQNSSGNPNASQSSEDGFSAGIVAIHTGWGAKWGTPDWDRQPCLSVEAARWLLERRVKLLAVDTCTPDVPLDRRPPDFNWPVHRTLLAHGILIAEQLANLGALSGQRVEFLFGPLPIAGSDGSPARVLARPIA